MPDASQFFRAGRCRQVCTLRHHDPDTRHETLAGLSLSSYLSGRKSKTRSRIDVAAAERYQPSTRLISTTLRVVCFASHGQPR